MTGLVRTVAVLCPAGWLFLLGCATTAQSNRPQTLTACQNPQELDVPFPASFRFAEDASEDYRDGRRRVYVRHRYVGSADKQTVRRFYQQEMPLARWSLISNANLHGVYVLRYEKGAEACEITIRDASQGRAGAVVIDVRITPLESGKTPSVTGEGR